MPRYSYRASTREGEIVTGVLEAPDRETALERLKDSGVIPLGISDQKEEGKKRLFRSLRDDLITFTTELSALLGAGLPLDRSLAVLAEVTERKRMREVIESLSRTIREGSSFSEALRKHPEVFPPLYVNMVRSGEEGGTLERVVEKLSELLESEKEVRDYVSSSMIYPAILLATSGASIIIVLTYVVPRFSGIFEEFGAELPLPTRILLAISGALKSYWWVLAGLLLLGFVAFRSFVRTESGRRRWDAIKLKLARDLIVRVETARFSRTLGMLLESGVPMVEAVKSAREVVGNRAFYTALEEVPRGIREGKGITVPLSRTGVFPPLFLSMVRVGEETGNLERMLLKAASAYETSLRTTVKRFLSLLEPALILGTGIVVGFIAFSIFLAVFSVVDIPF
ncbi:MAG: type II secretion system F family protein [Deltaproteobacteria bacterium]|nr:MAG: type II secretion system F family protein [Deltaproteobacteria bacterium]